MSLATVLIIVLVLLLVSALPLWQRSATLGYGAGGLLGVVLIVLLVMYLLGRL